MPAKITSVNLG
jgi:hypothetical protein